MRRGSMTARELGATHTVNMQAREPRRPASRDLRPDGADVVCDATGASRPLEDAIELARPNGQITKVGWSPDKLAVDMNPLVLRNVRIEGSFEPQLSGVGARHSPARPPPRRIPKPSSACARRSTAGSDAFDAMHDRRVIKSVLLPNGH